MTSTINKTGIIVFLKNPEEGKVKTRLAADCGNRFAALFYKLCAEELVGELQLLDRNSFELFLFYSERGDESKVKNWLRGNYFYFPQEGETLGDRIFNAFSIVLGKGYQKAIIVGSDVPDIKSEHIVMASHKLENADLVSGPCFDGGYYLLGIKKLYKELFFNIPWSTDKVLESTNSAADKLKLTIQTVEELADIDTKSDLDLWLEKLKGNISLKNKVRRLLE